MIAYHRRLPDDHASAMVDKEGRADGGAWMDVDASVGVGMLLHDAWEQRNAALLHCMRKAVGGERANAWIAEHDLVNVPSGGVSVVGGLHV